MVPPYVRTLRDATDAEESFASFLTPFLFLWTLKRPKTITSNTHNAPNTEPTTIPVTEPAVKPCFVSSCSRAGDWPEELCGVFVGCWVELRSLCGIPGGDGTNGGGGGAGLLVKEFPSILDKNWSKK